MKTKTYSAKFTGTCEACDCGIRKGMPIIFVAPLPSWQSSWKRSVAIHASCAKLYTLAA